MADVAGGGGVGGGVAGASGGAAASGASGAASGASGGSTLTSANLSGGGEQHWSHTAEYVPQDLRGHAALLKAKTPGDALKEFVGAQELIGRKGIIAPTDWSDKTQVRSFLEKLPETMRPPATETDYKLPDNVKFDENTNIPVDKTRAEKFRKLAYELNLSNEQAAKLVEMQAKSEYDLLSSGKVQSEAKAKAELDEFLGSLGNQRDLVVADAKLGYKNLDEDGSLKSFLDSTGAGNVPVVIKAFAKIGKLFREDVAHRGGGTGAGFGANTADGGRSDEVGSCCRR